MLEPPDRTSSPLAQLQKAKLQMMSAFTDCKSLVFQRDDELSHHLDPEFGSEKALLMDPPLKYEGRAQTQKSWPTNSQYTNNAQ